MSDAVWTGLETWGAVCVPPWQETAQTWERARRMGAWFGVRTVRRKNRSFARILREEGVTAVLVADAEPTWYHAQDLQHAFRFHPGMAWLRLQAMEQGRADRLLTAAGIAPGDTVLDATLGMGVDALVLAAGVSDTGRVVACESSFVLARTFTWAIRERHGYEPRLAKALARIEVQECEHGEWLSSLPDDSVDVVYFDPMFRRAPDRTTPLDVIRPFASPQPLSDRAWREACRVARKAVVLKERPRSGEFERFGILPDKPSARFAYGVWRKR
ncbi:class I SAM-dependent methyltransferase [Alicyclobacillus kakegawensis]|uniref:class I SAM-dependent methyltransferase n=1 Tax=Alicyclobacillus kakegawensis TaxID=392012 RepID=UPI00082DF92E|nr:class I SAM-dependent methyltransferase [Alicyclobacillus kakegawensis]